jgi:hypothetical protein
MYRSLVIFLFSILLFTSCARRAEQTAGTAPAKDAADTASVMVSAPETDAAEPAIVPDGQGNFYVAFVAHYPDKKADLLVRKYGRDLKPAGEPVRVNPVAGMVKAWRGDPPVMTVSRDGTLFIGWTAKPESAADHKATDLMLSASRDGGRSFEAPVPVKKLGESESYGIVNLISDTGGQIGVVWLDEGDLKARQTPVLPGGAAMMMFHKKDETEPNKTLLFSASVDGGKTFSAAKKLASEVCPCCKTSMTTAPDGRIYVSWRQVLPGGFRHIAVASSADKGATFSEGAIVSDDKWQINACPVSGASMSVDAGGVLSVLWYSAGEAGEAGLYAADSRDGGRTFGPRRLVSAEAVSGMPVLPGNGFSVFAAKENSVIVRSGPVSGTADGRTQVIRDASLPAAVLAEGKPVVAFVRTEGEKRSVLLSALSP